MKKSVYVNFGQRQYISATVVRSEQLLMHGPGHVVTYRCHRSEKQLHL